ncbi:FAD-dependent oxidoreductase [Streptomyces sp. NPDC051561]|uniref:FAD-dependent oxidoreductase n=1 Tax=Streptomyces sp. NPDC051561 TaxID=3365658 RepID=UPI0037A60F47
MELNSVKGAAPDSPRTDTQVDAQVIVVGAGPTGLALACDLARRGVSVLVLERADRLFPGSRGKGIQPRTMEVLDDLGVIGEVLASGGPAPVSMAWRASGERLGPYDMFEPTQPTEAEPYAGRPWMLAQWRTQEILHARLHKLGGEVEFEADVRELTQDAGGVSVRLGDGRTVRGAYAVAADGGRSTVRTALGIRMKGETVDPAPALVADVRIRPRALDRDNWHLFPQTPGGLLALCPLPGTEDFQLMAQYADESATPDTSPEGVRQLIATRSHLAADDVTEVRWASDFRPRTALADSFRSGRVFLAGDAAHIHSPAGGQGLNTSVQDAYNLGWKLGQVLRHGADPALLDTYEAERRPLAAEMLGLSTRVHRGEQRRGAATQQLGLGYRGGPLSSGAAGVLVAGDRAPDGVLPDGSRLFDAYRGPHFTLLAVGGATGITPEAYGSAWLRTAQIPACEAYGDGIFLVRPDGYVAWAGSEVSPELPLILRQFGDALAATRRPGAVPTAGGCRSVRGR